MMAEYNLEFAKDFCKENDVSLTAWFDERTNRHCFRMSENGRNKHSYGYVPYGEEESFLIAPFLNEMLKELRDG